MRTKGFTLIEALTATALLSIVASFAIPVALKVTRYQQGENASMIVASQLAMARQGAISHRQQFRVRFESPNEVVRESFSAGQWVLESTVPLPGEVAFSIESGIPAGGEEAPDGFSATSPVSFNGSNSLIFRPDGSARDAQGRLANGVVHMAWPNLPDSARAVTVLGSTGRVRSWRVEAEGENGWSWH